MPATLLVITGLSASGKTYLGSRLARQLGWPFVSKDEYKETLHDHLPDLTRQQAGPLSFEIMYQVAGVVLAAGVNTVLETHFYRGMSEPILLNLAERHGATVLQVFCHAPLDELMRRHDERVAVGEHPHIHQAWLYHAPVPDHACSEPLVLGGDLLRLDTTKPDTVSGALAWVRARLETPALN
jgi:predicted kinase